MCPPPSINELPVSPPYEYRLNSLVSTKTVSSASPTAPSTSTIHRILLGGLKPRRTFTCHNYSRGSPTAANPCRGVSAGRTT